MIDPEHPIAAWHGERWQRHQYDRLYVRTEDGAPVGWYDLASGDTHAVDPTLHQSLLGFVQRWMRSPEGCAIGLLPLPRVAPRPQPARTPAQRTRPRHPEPGRLPGAAERPAPPSASPREDDRSAAADPLPDDGDRRRLLTRMWRERPERRAR